MTEAKHTPGPWETSGVRVTRAINGEWLQIVGPKGLVALTCYSDATTKDHVESHADQCLIAAAPDMLEALRDLCNRVDEDTNYVPESEAYLRARAAIIKATGAS
jgi:hypothetical protein